MRACAICDVTNDTTDLCSECAADPANIDWRPRPRWEVSDSERVGAVEAGADVTLPPARVASSIERRVLAIITGRAPAWQYTTVPRYDRQGRKRGSRRVRQRVTSIRGIARWLGCSHERVRQVLLRHAAA